LRRIWFGRGGAAREGRQFLSGRLGRW